MAQTAMTVRLDNQVKVQFDRLCEEFGMSANTAINIFVKAVVRSGSIPFPIETKKEEDPVRQRAIEAFKEMRRIAESRPGPDITLEEINEEIRAARKEMKMKNN